MGPTLRLAFALAIAASLAQRPATPTNPSSQQTDLLHASNLTSLGSFRVPGRGYGGSLTSPIAFNPARRSLFMVVGPPGAPAPAAVELGIPTDLSGNAYATLLQGPVDPTEGHLGDVDPTGTGNGTLFKGLLVVGNQLYGDAYKFYDAEGTQSVSHFRRSTTLTTPSFSGWYHANGAPSGLIAGAMADIPAAFQASLGGKALTGLCCVSIITRTSWGPAAFAFDPAQMTTPAKPFPVAPLSYYTADHATLGPGDTAKIAPYFSQADYPGGIVFPAGFSSVLHLYRRGTGQNNCSPGFTYGPGTTDCSLAGKPSDDPHYLWCYDPVNQDQGDHAWPYEYVAVAYDARELARVHAGRKQPWDMTPYEKWTLDLGTSPAWTPLLGGAAYDPGQQRIYIALTNIDTDAADTAKPRIFVFQVH